MGDISSRRFCTHLDFPDSLYQPPLPKSPPPSISDSDDTDFDFPLHFPLPPSISPALRRMRSSPWFSEQLTPSHKPDHRHSVSPLIQHPIETSQSNNLCLHQYNPVDFIPHSQLSYTSSFSKRNHDLEMFGEALVDPSRSDLLQVHNDNQKRSVQKDPPLPRRLEQLPPPVPAPSIPLPRLPRIIRKVASMRSDSKHASMEPQRKSLPKIKSLKFLSGYGNLGDTVLHPLKTDSTNRTWSFSRPASLPRPKVVQVSESSSSSSYAGPNPDPSGNLHSATSYNEWSIYAPRTLHNEGGYASPTVYSNLCLVGNEYYQPESIVSSSFASDARFDLSRSPTLAPPFTHQEMNNSTTQTKPYHYLSSFNPRAGYHRSMDNIALGRGINLGRSGSILNYNLAGSGPLLSSHSEYIYGNVDSGKSPKSFMNITPERRKSRGSKSRDRMMGPNGAAEGRGLQMSTTMKVKGSKMKRLFVRASSGFVDWGRQLRGRSSKAPVTRSVSESLAPPTRM